MALSCLTNDRCFQFVDRFESAAGLLHTPGIHRYMDPTLFTHCQCEYTQIVLEGRHHDPITTVLKLF